MTKFCRVAKPLLLFALLLLYNSINAQSIPTVKPDTAKATKKAALLINADTLKKTGRSVFIPHIAEFDKIDLSELAPDIQVQQYGVVDTSDLKMTACDFEKDANAMVLFDNGIMHCGLPVVLLGRHKRIKIFNENGKSEANIRIEFNNRFGTEYILMVEAETITLENGKIEYTKLDPKLIYTEHTDKEKDMVTFSLPNVKPGSVVEYRYLWERQFSRNVPEWDFQCDLPTRYSQLELLSNPNIVFSALSRKDKPYAKDTTSLSGLGHVWALKNIPPTKDEPFMRSAADALQSLTFIIRSIKFGSEQKDISASWADVGKQIATDRDFYRPFDQSLPNEDDLVKQANALQTTDQKVAFIFNQVKTQMKWNEEKNWYSKDGIKSAWKKKSGNWGEMNMIVCHLLKLSGISAYPMLVSTRDNGSLLPNFINLYQINKLVTYVPVDSAKYYVLDATDKFNTYNDIPFDLLNSNGLVLNKEKAKYDLVYMKKDAPVKEVVLINAEIMPGGNMNGTAEIGDYSYNKAINLERNKKLDEKEYFEYLTNNDNNIKITSLKLEGADVDSLPLIQHIEFNMDLPGTDDKYIYFNPNLFTSLNNNPFISEQRVSDIDFGCADNYSIIGRYKIPAGYKIESIPESINLVIKDNSITFKRMIESQPDLVMVHYIISYKKSRYLQADYPSIYAYFKKMEEVLNEQIVLKKQ